MVYQVNSRISRLDEDDGECMRDFRDINVKTSSVLITILHYDETFVIFTVFLITRSPSQLE